MGTSTTMDLAVLDGFHTKGVLDNLTSSRHSHLVQYDGHWPDILSYRAGLAR